MWNGEYVITDRVQCEAFELPAIFDLIGGWIKLILATIIDRLRNIFWRKWFSICFGRLKTHPFDCCCWKLAKFHELQMENNNFASNMKLARISSCDESFTNVRSGFGLQSKTLWLVRQFMLKYCRSVEMVNGSQILTPTRAHYMPKSATSHHQCSVIVH